MLYSGVSKFKENEHKVRGSVKANVSSSARISCVSHCESVLEKKGKAFYVWLMMEAVMAQ
jgi:hypothetical protein